MRVVFFSLFQEYGPRFPLALKLLLKQLFVDDVMATARDTPSAITLLEQLIGLFQFASMRVHKINTNHPDFKRWLQDKGIYDNSLGIMDLLNKVTKALGVRWDTNTDEFYFQPNEIIQEALNATKVTKRVISKLSSKVFDPLGLVCAVNLQFKILFQELWTLNIGWDTLAPDELVSTNSF